MDDFDPNHLTVGRPFGKREQGQRLSGLNKRIPLAAIQTASAGLAVLLCSFGIAAQSSSSAQIVTQPTPTSSVSKVEPLSEKRQLALLSVHSLANNILAFQAKTAKPVALAKLADLIWKDEEVYARQMFSSAIEVCSPNNAKTDEEKKLLAKLRPQVISLIARHDPRWAKRLLQEDGITQADERMENNFAVAYDTLAKNPAKSVTFADLSLQDGVFPYMSSYLLKLRSQNEAAANALFLRVLDRMVALGAIDGNELLHLGTYVFTSPKIDPANPSIPPEAVVQVGVGRFVVYDITADRPRVSLAMVRAYLAAAVLVLANGPGLDAQMQELYYVAGYILLPKVQRLAPELTGSLMAAMVALQEHVPSTLANPATYASLEKKADKDFDETLADIEKLSLERQRNERYLFLSFSLWSKKDFARARQVADKITDLEVGTKVNTLIDFANAADLLDRGPVSLPDAEKLANKLPKDIERSVLWLGIARSYEKAGDKQRAVDAITESLTAARNLHDRRRSLLILCAAGQLASLSRSLAMTALSESVRSFNDAKLDPESSLAEMVKIGTLKLYFPLRASGVDYNFAQALRPIAETDAVETLAAVAALTEESRRAEAFVVVSGVLLK